jgi:hypothetical protein
MECGFAEDYSETYRVTEATAAATVKNKIAANQPKILKPQPPQPRNVI